MVVYNTLQNTKSATDNNNDKDTYINLFNAIRSAFKSYLPSLVLASDLNFSEFYNLSIQKKLNTGNNVNYTYKLFNALETSNY